MCYMIDIFERKFAMTTSVQLFLNDRMSQNVYVQ